ncbi:MAG: hypothetical protein AB7O86_05585 [Porticoccaceae bacterium]
MVQNRKPRGASEAAETIGLPIRPFLYTLDQISTIIAVPVDSLIKRYIYFPYHTIGPHKRDFLMARNIAPVDSPPDWRVMESELIRWLRYRGFTVIETAWSRTRMPPRG